MEEKRRDFVRPLLTIAIVLLSIFVGMKIAQMKTAPKAFQFILPNKEQDKLSLIINYVKEHYVDSVDMKKIEEAIIPDLLKELDPHSVYIPATRMQATNESLQGNFDGIGISFNMPYDTVIVINVIPGGPSERAGILAGDRIITVNDSIIAGPNIDTDSVMLLLRGKSGSKVTVGVKRDNDHSLVPITITRGKIPLKSIDVAYMVAPEIGYVKMTKFARTTHVEFKKAVDDLHKKGMKSIILDLRQNTGGLLEQAYEIANEFLPKGKLIVYTEGRTSRRKDLYSNGSGSCINDSVVILIDEGSASASEILAGAIQDNDRGLIIGRRSFGKGLVQEPVNFSDGSGMRLTIARYYTPTGRSIQRAYGNDIEEYYFDKYSRIEHGEFMHADSIHHNDSLKYVTPGGKIVYGGGGITPDIFTPFDTTGVTEYFISVSRRNLVYKYVLGFLDDHRKDMREIADLDALRKFYNDKNLLDNFVDYAARNGVKYPSKKELSECGFLIETHLKAYIARSTPLDDEGYFYVLNIIDSTVQRAVSELNKIIDTEEELGNAKKEVFSHLTYEYKIRMRTVPDIGLIAGYDFIEFG